MPPQDASHHLVLCTCPDADSAGAIARALVEEGLAACVNIVTGLTSVYRWQGEIQSDPEVLLLIKSRGDHFEALERAVVARHPYELPELICVPIAAGSAGYLNWIDECLDART